MLSFPLLHRRSLAETDHPAEGRSALAGSEPPLVAAEGRKCRVLLDALQKQPKPPGAEPCAADGLFRLDGVPAVLGLLVVRATLATATGELNGLSSPAQPVQGGAVVVGDILVSELFGDGADGPLVTAQAGTSWAASASPVARTTATIGTS